MSLTHFDAAGQAHMVDVSEKSVTDRIATASGWIKMLPETLALIESGTAKKGDVLGIARLAGIMGAKKTADLIPLCHPLPITKVAVELVPDAELPGVRIEATVKTTGQTGVEMEALTAASTAALTVYESVILALKQGAGGWRLSAPELAAVDNALNRFGIAHLADHQLAELSGGQRQSVSIAQTLVSRPRIVLMDEPTSALDLHRQFEVLQALQTYAAETGAVILLALHDLNQAMRCCATTLAIANGRTLGTGPTLDVLTPDLIRDLYGIEARVESCSRGCPVMIVDGSAHSTQQQRRA